MDVASLCSWIQHHHQLINVERPRFSQILSGRANSAKRLLVPIRWKIKENLDYLLHEVNDFFISALFFPQVLSGHLVHSVCFPLSFSLSLLLFFPSLHPSLISLLSLSSWFHFVWCLHHLTFLLFSPLFTNLTSLLSYYICLLLFPSLYNRLLILGNFNIHACCPCRTLVTEVSPVLDCFRFLSIDKWIYSCSWADSLASLSYGFTIDNININDASLIISKLCPVHCVMPEHLALFPIQLTCQL